MKHLLVALLLVSVGNVQVHAGYKNLKNPKKNSKKLLHVYSLGNSSYKKTTHKDTSYESEIEEDSLALYCKTEDTAFKKSDRKLERRGTKTKGYFKTVPNPESNKAEIHATCAILTKSAQQINQDRRKKRTAATMMVINTN